MRRSTAALLAGAAALVLAGCASGDQGGKSLPEASGRDGATLSATGAGSEPRPSSTPASDRATHSTPIAPSTPGTEGAACRTGQLDLRIGQVTGGAGTFAIPVIFTNSGQQKCTLSGYPGVSYLASADGPQIGPSANRYGDSHGTVVLHTGDSATALVLTVNVGMLSQQQCGPTPVAGLRIYPPDNDEPLFLPFTRFKTCSRSGALRVEAVEHGIHP